MTQALETVFDGEVLCLQEPLELEPNTRVRIVVETLPQNGDAQSVSFLDAAMSLKLGASPDGSQNVDKYLYGELHDDE